MSNPYYKANNEPPAHISELLTSLQAAIDRAYQDGYEAAILQLEKEYRTNEHETRTQGGITATTYANAGSCHSTADQ